jgi:hypothetical protein
MKILIIAILIVLLLPTFDAFAGRGGRIVHERNKRRKEEQLRQDQQYKYDILHHPEKTMSPVNPILDYKNFLVNLPIRYKMCEPHEWIFALVVNYLMFMTFVCIIMYCGTYNNK